MKREIINEIIKTEGGYVDDPADSGGATKYGITEETARRYGYGGTMASLSRDLAFRIYEDRYWLSVSGDELAELSGPVVREVVDTGANMGTTAAVRILQRALNVFNDRGRLYADIKPDGIAGPATVGALRAYLAHRDERALVRALNCLQGARYIELAERREKDERFVYGWIKNRVTL